MICLSNVETCAEKFPLAVSLFAVTEWTGPISGVPSVRAVADAGTRQQVYHVAFLLGTPRNTLFRGPKKVQGCASRTIYTTVHSFSSDRDTELISGVCPEGGWQFGGCRNIHELKLPSNKRHGGMFEPQPLSDVAILGAARSKTKWDEQLLHAVVSRAMKPSVGVPASPLTKCTYTAVPEVAHDHFRGPHGIEYRYNRV